MQRDDRPVSIDRSRVSLTGRHEPTAGIRVRPDESRVRDRQWRERIVECHVQTAGRRVRADQWRVQIAGIGVQIGQWRV